MLCKVKIRGTYKNSNQFEAAVTLLDCSKPIFATGTEIQIGYEKRIKNLSLCFYFESNTVTCQNSLHRFYHGHNANTYTRSQIKETIGEISELVKIEPSQLLFSSIEVAVNLSRLKHDSRDYLFQPLSYRGIPFYCAEPPGGSNKIMERFCRLTEGKVKIYDQRSWLKTLERIDIGQEQVRFERVISRSRPIYKLLNCNTLPSTLLYTESVLRLLGAHLLKTYQTMDKRLICDYSPFKPQEIQLLRAGENDKFWDDLNPHPESKHKMRTDYLRLKRIAAGNDNLTAEVEKKIAEQIELICVS